MNCPRKCTAPLRSVSLPDFGGAEIHLCSECDGAWYPHGVLVNLGSAPAGKLETTELGVALEADKLEKIDADAPAQCPVCSQTMTRFAYTLAPRMKIDECLEHGTWLDDGELGTILQSIAESRADMAEDRRLSEEQRQEMDMTGIARGGSALNPFALTIRVLNALFSKPKG